MIKPKKQTKRRKGQPASKAELCQCQTQLIRLKLGETIQIGDYCFDSRVIIDNGKYCFLNPVFIEESHNFTVTTNHHPIFRILKKCCSCAGVPEQMGFMPSNVKLTSPPTSVGTTKEEA